MTDKPVVRCGQERLGCLIASISRPTAKLVRISNRRHLWPCHPPTVLRNLCGCNQGEPSHPLPTHTHAHAQRVRSGLDFVWSVSPPHIATTSTTVCLASPTSKSDHVNVSIVFLSLSLSRTQTHTLALYARVLTRSEDING